MIVVRVQYPKPARPIMGRPEPLDLRTPSGRALPFYLPES